MDTLTQHQQDCQLANELRIWFWGDLTPSECKIVNDCGAVLGKDVTPLTERAREELVTIRARMKTRNEC